MPDAGLGWVRQPNVSTTINTGNGLVTVRTDARGYRVGPAGPTIASRRILLLGDSFMEALQVDHELSTAGRLEAALATALGTTVAVRNAAVGGWDPNHYRIQLHRSLADETFDLALVVIYFGNDVVDRMRDSFPPRPTRPKPRFRVPRWPTDIWAALVAPVGAVLETRSHLYQLVAGAWRTGIRRAGEGSPGIPRYLRTSEAGSARWDITGDIYLALTREAADADVPVLFVLIPPVERILADVLRTQARHDGLDPSELDADQPARMIGERLTRHGVPFLDLTLALSQAAVDGRAVYGRVDRHFTAAGHEVTVTTILPHVVAAMSADSTFE